MKIEEDGVNWRKEKRITNMLKNHLPQNKELIKAFTKSIGRFFAYMSNHKHGMDKLFPKFTGITSVQLGRGSNDIGTITDLQHKSSMIPFEVFFTKGRSNVLRRIRKNSSVSTNHLSLKTSTTKLNSSSLT